jgi:xanthine dehydrogenase accessory factor
VLVDGIMAKVNTGTRLDDAPLVVGIGPGFYAGQDCHAVIETDRGHDLGRVIRYGSAAPDTGLPGALPGLPPTASRVLRAPQSGHVTPFCAIGDTLDEGALVATVTCPGGDPMPVHAPFRGVVRGLVHPSVVVRAGMKIGDLDPRARREYCFTVSDKSLAIGGGVLEVVCAYFFGREQA